MHADDSRSNATLMSTARVIAVRGSFAAFESVIKGNQGEVISPSWSMREHCFGYMSGPSIHYDLIM